MPDLMNFTISQQGSGQARTWRVSCQIVSSTDHNVILADLTGGQAILFPNVFLGLPDSDQLEFIQSNAMWMIQKVAPQAFIGGAAPAGK